jgi:DNA-binding transcriptional regulator/RsmH inhibitor MraZ
MVLTSAAFESISQRVNQMSVTDPAAVAQAIDLFSWRAAGGGSAGRILIPQFYGCRRSGEVTLVGAGDYFEIWSPGGWDEQSTQLRDSNTNAPVHRFRYFFWLTVVHRRFFTMRL